MSTLMRLVRWFNPFAPIVLPSPRPITPQEGREADARALRSDWEAVGQDMRIAIDRVEAGEE